MQFLPAFLPGCRWAQVCGRLGGDGRPCRKAQKAQKAQTPLGQRPGAPNLRTGLEGETESKRRDGSSLRKSWPRRRARPGRGVCRPHSGWMRRQARLEPLGTEAGQPCTAHTAAPRWHSRCWQRRWASRTRTRGRSEHHAHARLLRTMFHGKRSVPNRRRTGLALWGNSFQGGPRTRWHVREPTWFFALWTDPGTEP